MNQNLKVGQKFGVTKDYYVKEVIKTAATLRKILRNRCNLKKTYKGTNIPPPPTPHAGAMPPIKNQINDASLIM